MGQPIYSHSSCLFCVFACTLVRFKWCGICLIFNRRKFYLNNITTNNELRAWDLSHPSEWLRHFCFPPGNYRIANDKPIVLAWFENRYHFQWGIWEMVVLPYKGAFDWNYVGSGITHMVSIWQEHHFHGGVGFMNANKNYWVQMVYSSSATDISGFFCRFLQSTRL